MYVGKLKAIVLQVFIYGFTLIWSSIKREKKVIKIHFFGITIEKPSNMQKKIIGLTTNMFAITDNLTVLK